MIIYFDLVMKSKKSFNFADHNQDQRKTEAKYKSSIPQL